MDGHGAGGIRAPHADQRHELLLKMYDQMFSDINRHILVIWQSVGVLIGAFAVFALAEKNVIPIDVAVALIILISVWLLSHLLDAAYWYNRNLVIIANIERQFLDHEDIKDIHYYFGAHRPNNKMLTHIRIQFAFGVWIGLLVLVFHFSTRVWPGLDAPWGTFDPTRLLPYIAVLWGLYYVPNLRKNTDEKYAEFLRESPGREIDVSDVSYGIGHGFPNARNKITRGAKAE